MATTKWLDEGPQWLDEPDEFDKSIKAGTNTLGQVVGDAGGRILDFLSGPFNKTDQLLGGKGKTAEKAAALGTQVGDMMVGFPADAVGKGRNALARLEMAGTATQKQVGQAAEASEDLGPRYEWMKTPIASLKKLATGKESKEVIPVSKWIGSYADTIEKKTNGWITSEDVKFALGSAFDTLGMAGLHAGAVKLGQRVQARAEYAGKVKAADELRTKGEAEAKAQADEVAAKQTELKRPASEEEIRAGLKDQAQYKWNDRLANQERWLDEEGYTPPESVRPTEVAPKTGRLDGGEPIVGVEQPETPTGNATLEAAQVKAREGKLFDLTAEERIALREAGEQQSLVVDAAGKPTQGRYQSGQAGSVDPKLLAGMAAIGGGAAAGAYLGEDLRSTVWGALAGALAGTKAGRGILISPRAGLDKTLGLTSTRIGNISPALLLRARDLEKGVMQRTDRALDASHPFVEQVSKLKPEEQAAVENALLNGGELPPALQKAYGPVRKLLDSLGAELKGLGRFKEGVADYFPRIVKDLDGLKEAIGATNAKGLEKALLDAQAKSKTPLTDIEQSIIVNRWLAAPDQVSFLPGYARARKLGEITPELQKFYEKPTDSLVRYISGAISDVEKAKFFGKDLKNKVEGGKAFVDTEASIGALTQRLVDEGKINREQLGELRSMLSSRFVGGEKAMAGPLQDVRNLSNLGLLGNAWSAATQVGDSLMTVYHQGMIPTYQALVQKATGKEALSPKQLGIINHVMEEISTQRTSGKALSAGLKLSAFQAIDQFAKGLGTNAALIKARNLASTPKGLERLSEKWGEAFGDDFPQLVADLKEGKITDLTESLAFSELSNMQPISKLEMPQAYLDNPNGRLLYQMKTYMLKQADIVRRDVYQEIKKGNVARGVKNAALLAGTYTVANVPGDAIKAFLSGQDFDITGPGLMENVLQTFGVNRYAADELRQGKIVQVVKDTAFPPAPGMLVDALSGKDQAVRYVPIVGRGLYDWFFGGNERKEISGRNRDVQDYRKEHNIKKGEPTPEGAVKPLSPGAQKLKDSWRGVDAAPEESQGIKSLRAITAREEFRQQQREEVAKEAFKRFGRKGLRDFLAEEEQAEIRKAMPRRRTTRETM